MCNLSAMAEDCDLGRGGAATWFVSVAEEKKEKTSDTGRKPFGWPRRRVRGGCDESATRDHSGQTGRLSLHL